jgi:DNA-binding transcriptional LysR family regulator
MNLRRVNLNLLPILDALLDCRNVTRAGEQLRLSQPATSSALAKLRHMFSDELLVPIGRELQLTPKAQQLRQPIKELLAQLESQLEDYEFDPLLWRAHVHIATADYVAMLLLPILLEELRTLAPNLTLHITNITRKSASDLRADEIDMIIAPEQVVSDALLMCRHLFDDRFVCVYSRKHEPKKLPLTMEEYLSRPHVTFQMDPPIMVGTGGQMFRELDDLRERQCNLATMPFYGVMPFLLDGAPYFAMVQERIVKKMQEFLDIDYTDPPIDLAALRFCIYWNPRLNDDPAHSWLRKIISRAGAQIAQQG